MESNSLSPWLGLLTSIVSLVFVLTLAWLLLRWLKRSAWGPAAGADSATPRVLRAVGLGPRERLVVVLHHDVELLLGVSATSITVLERRRIDRPAASTPETAGTAPAGPGSDAQPT